jgi:hypothetical protein
MEMTLEQLDVLDWEDVESSNVTRVAFVVGTEKDAGTLYVVFRHSFVYAYYGVPRETFKGLTDAESVGSYFNDAVRPSHDCSRVRIVEAA